MILINLPCQKVLGARIISFISFHVKTVYVKITAFIMKPNWNEYVHVVVHFELVTRVNELNAQGTLYLL